MIDVGEETEVKIEDIMKRDGFKSKGEVVDFLAEQYVEEVKPEFIEEIKRIRKGKFYSQEEFDELMR